MRKLKFLALLLFFSAPLFAGFGAGTAVSSRSTLVPIEQLQVGDLVDCYEQDSDAQRYVQKAVTCKQSHTAGEYLVLVIGESRLIISSDQKLYLPEHEEWIEACDCVVGDLLLGRHGLVAISAIFTVHEPVTFFDITVQDCHNFLVLPDGILVHNILPVFIGVTAAFGGGVVADWCLTAGIAGIAAIGIKLAKNKFNVRDDARFIIGHDAGNISYHDKKHPHGKFEGVDYHSQKGSGRKSPGPQNGQEALDRSVPIKKGSPHRVGISAGEIVVLRQTAKDLYHGYVMVWEEIASSPAADAIRRALIKNGLVNLRGKIL